MRSRVILILSNVISSGESIKIGFGLITQQLDDFETRLYDHFEYFTAQFKLLTPIRNRVILILSAVVATRDSIKIGSGPITQ